MYCFHGKLQRRPSCLFLLYSRPCTYCAVTIAKQSILLRLSNCTTTLVTYNHGMDNFETSTPYFWLNNGNNIIKICAREERNLIRFFSIPTWSPAPPFWIPPPPKSTLFYTPFENSTTTTRCCWLSMWFNRPSPDARRAGPKRPVNFNRHARDVSPIK